MLTKELYWYVEKFSRFDQKKKLDYCEWTSIHISRVYLLMFAIFDSSKISRNYYFHITCQPIIALHLSKAQFDCFIFVSIRDDLTKSCNVKIIMKIKVTKQVEM